MIRSRSLSRASSQKSQDGDGVGDEEDDKDYKKLYENLNMKFELLKRDAATREAAINRERRQQERKLSEFEEDMNRIEQIRTANHKLKEENTALIRVINKLAK